MDSGRAGKLKYELRYEQLLKYTDNFSDKNFLGTFQFGKVYRGKIEHFTHGMQHVMVKMWEVPTIYRYFHGDNEARLTSEYMLLRHENLIHHPGIIELFGYCWDGEYLGIVYNFEPLDIVSNLVPKNSFTWLQRIKVAVGFARFLKFLHTGTPTFKPYLVRNIAAAHIVIDEDYNPKLYDFSMISGGSLPDRTVYQSYYLYGSYGYEDYSGYKGRWTNKTDVFAFAIILLNLVSKRIGGHEEVAYWAHDSYKCTSYPFIEQYKAEHCTKENLYSLYSLVNPCFEMDPDYYPGDGRKISKLVMRCLDVDINHRPSMKKVLKHLLKLQVVKKHAEYLGLH